MADKTIPSFVGMAPSGDVELGRVQLAPEVLEVIIGIATTKLKVSRIRKGILLQVLRRSSAKWFMVKVSKQIGLKMA